MIGRQGSLKLLVTVLVLVVSGCTSHEENAATDAIVVFKHGKIAGDPALFRSLLNRFEAETGIAVKDETLPASTDEQHQFYVINLEGRSSDFDVLSMDVIWVPEFARAGWLGDLSDLLPEAERGAFFPGPMQAVTYRNRVYAVPWYIDAGILYYRKDLLDKYGLKPPRTWKELVGAAGEVMKKEDAFGYIFQGKQYEGLVCNVLEFMWGNGGRVLKDGRITINSPENIAALGLVRDLLVKFGVTPPLVTTAAEEQTRHIFGNGRALFMRNWPYAWNLFEQEGSPIRGKVGVEPLPSFAQRPSASTLGGWQLGINKYSRVPDKAASLIRFLTSPESQKTLALTLGYKPTRTSLYRDRELMKKQPFIVELYSVFMRARPRPVTPYYMMISQVMQPEFSAALTGIKTPKEALESAQRQIEHILGEEEP